MKRALPYAWREAEADVTIRADQDHAACRDASADRVDAGSREICTRLDQRRSSAERGGVVMIPNTSTWCDVPANRVSRGSAARDAGLGARLAACFARPWSTMSGLPHSRRRSSSARCG